MALSPYPGQGVCCRFQAWRPASVDAIDFEKREEKELLEPRAIRLGERENERLKESQDEILCSSLTLFSRCSVYGPHTSSQSSKAMLATQSSPRLIDRLSRCVSLATHSLTLAASFVTLFDLSKALLSPLS